MRNLQIRIVTDLTAEPVTLDEAKNFCKVTGSQDDELITLLIIAAREAMEKYTQSTFAQKTIHAIWVKPPDDDEYELPYGPHIAVTAVYRIDAEGTETAMTVNSDYWVYGDQDFTLKVNRYWSSRGEYVEQTYRIEYTAGYGHSNTQNLPAALKLAILKEVVTQYELRENVVVGMGAMELTNESRAVAGPYRKKLWF